MEGASSSLENPVWAVTVPPVGLGLWAVGRGAGCSALSTGAGPTWARGLPVTARWQWPPPGALCGAGAAETEPDRAGRIDPCSQAAGPARPRTEFGGFGGGGALSGRSGGGGRAGIDQSAAGGDGDCPLPTHPHISPRLPTSPDTPSSPDLTQTRAPRTLGPSHPYVFLVRPRSTLNSTLFTAQH